MRRPRSAMTIRISLLLCLQIAFLLPVAAHDLQTIVRMEGRIVVLEASYEGEEEASFVAVSVQAPAGNGASSDAFQKGRTDLRGHFAFVPDRAGDWKITVDDEMGHRVTETVPVLPAALSADATQLPATDPAADSAGGRSSRDKLIVGLSVLFGASGFLMAILTRRRKPASA